MLGILAVYRCKYNLFILKSQIIFKMFFKKIYLEGYLRRVCCAKAIMKRIGVIKNK